MLDRASRIRRLYPLAVPMVDFIVGRVGSEPPTIEYWSKELGEPPTDEQLLAVDMSLPTQREQDRRAMMALKLKASADTLDAGDIRQVVQLLLKREG